MASEVLSNAGNQIRDHLVMTAVQFLNNPIVNRCTLESKERFLRTRGLTDLEIQMALEKTAEMIDFSSMTPELLKFEARRNLLRDHLLPMLMYGGIAYSCYWFYKNCIKQLLFVEQPKRKSTSECIEELRKSLDVLNSNMTSLRGEMQAANQQTAARSQISDLQTDIAAVKGILLNKNQFPAYKSRAEGIPAWQMGALPAEERPRSRRSESGGSNSSGEHAAKNSDSSLEIMPHETNRKKVSMDEPEPPNAWSMWLSSEKKNLLAQYPNLKGIELAKVIRDVWHATDKTPWEKKAADALQKYEAECNDD